MRNLIQHSLRCLALVCALCLIVADGAVRAGQPAFSLDPFPHARTIVDSGAALGSDAAQVPLSGHAPPGATVLARIPGRNGALSDWTAIATADTQGVWRGILGPLSRSVGWVRPQVRLDGSSTILRTAGEVAAGHVVTIWGQSELHRAVLPAHAALSTVGPVRDPSALQVTFSRSAKDDYGQRAKFVHTNISDDTPVTAHMVALSNMLAAAAPGERFHLVFHTRAGTGFQQLLSDAARGRVWADDINLHRFALPGGAQPGLAWVSWYNTDSSLGPRYGQVLYTALTGRNIDGSPFIRGTVPLGGRIPMDHTFADLYGGRTVWAIAGPHRFEMDKFDARIAANRASVDHLFAAHQVPQTVRRALEPLTYLNGNPRWGGDFSHPDTTAAPQDGMTRLMLLMGNSILRQLGLARWPLPAFDRAKLSADGTEIEVWSTTGSITTTRAIGSERDGLPVAGFAIDGQPARAATLRNGRVVIRYDDNGTPFPKGARLTFGAGGIGSENLVRDTRDRQVWQDYPIVDVGQTGIEGIPVKAQTPQSVLGVVPPVETPRSSSPPGSILAPAISRFAATASPPGWVAVGAGWTLDTATGTARAALTTSDALRASLPRGTLDQVSGKRMLLSFVPEATGSDPETLLVSVVATGGGTTELFSDAVVLTPGRRMILRLAPYPGNRNGLNITLRRRGAPTGDITLGSLGLYLAR